MDGYSEHDALWSRHEELYLHGTGDECLNFSVEAIELCVGHEELWTHTSEWKGLFLSHSPFLLTSSAFPNFLPAITDIYFFFLVSALPFGLTLFLAFSFPLFLLCPLPPMT